MRRGPAALLAVLAAACLVTACSAGEPESIMDKDTLVVGVRPDLPQIGLEVSPGSFQGFDVDVAAYLGKELGKEITFVRALAADRERLLLEDKADLVVATFSITQERKTKIGFAGPYHISYQDILVRPDESRITDVRSLAGRAMCAVEGSNAAERVVEERGVQARLVPAPDYDTCLPKLKSGEIDAITTNDIILAGLALRDGTGLKLLNAQFNEQRSGVGLRKGDVRGCEELNRAITRMYQDGTARMLLDKWFGKSGIDLSIVAVPQFEGCS
ncbi:transporter substrate-binding domain-containing protein [Nonomuraea soli]|uniref:Glutamate transport system substrate-binding protein n=1 Tax=Nonomuraea soli TaxID=1032476 RepID=A0A7W0HMY0_9ACTN|nr:transporter substrate-binding domain-containing protein [Nonomuraea soli]MBA2889207.1 glutamate transport system substrate-binding protein [Nonomuraea soli]